MGYSASIEDWVYRDVMRLKIWRLLRKQF